MSDDAPTVDRAALGRLEQLGKGGTAVIHRLPEFRLPGLPPLVFKEYNAKTRAFAGAPLGTGLLTLVQQRLRMPEHEQRRWDERIAWALRVVEDGAGACGILLPLIPDHFFQNLHSRTGEVERRPREVDLLCGADQDMTRVGLPAATPRQRLGVAVQIAKTCAIMHERKLVLGDISARNMVYDVNGPRPRVMVVDADGARVEGSRGAFGGQAQTPHWEPPEALRAAQLLRGAQKRADQSAMTVLRSQTMVQNRATDVYKLGLMVVRVVDHGRGRAVNRKPGTAITIFRDAWGRAAGEMLERSLSDQPVDRPTARELYDSMHRSGRSSHLGDGSTHSPPGMRTSDDALIAAGTRVGPFEFRPGVGWVRRGS